MKFDVKNNENSMKAVRGIEGLMGEETLPCSDR